MGLFDKKYCDVCGEKIGLLGNRKLDDGNLCKNCAAKLSPFFSERRHSTVAQIKEQLEEFYDVTPVKSGEAAFKFLLKRKPDLILLDYLMPDQDGPQVLRQLRTVEEYADIPVIFLTGSVEKNASGPSALIVSSIGC